jgi:transcriptional regulator with AAA-type ATPase domain
MKYKNSNRIKKVKWILTPGLLDEAKRFQNLHKVAKDRPIMICGPSGVGKTLFTNIYERLYRKDYPDMPEPVRLNCASFNEELLMGELFGYMPGAFTGALPKGKDGHIKKAEGGLLILEEIGDLPKTGQARLLTFIEDGYYYKVGGEKKQFANVKIIATTNKPIIEFREDFWYRFIPFYVSPLYKRRRDILYYMAKMFPDTTRLLSPWQILILLCYNWPGNVRELQRVQSIIRWELNNLHDRIPPENDNDFLDLEYVFDTHRLIEEKRYTELNSLGLGALISDLMFFGVNLDLLNKKLEKGGLSLSKRNDKIKPLKNIDKIQWKTDPKVEKLFNIGTCLRTEKIEKIYKTFLEFCCLFLQSPQWNHDLINVQEKYLPVQFSLYDTAAKTDEFRDVENKIVEYVIQKNQGKIENKLPDHSPFVPEVELVIKELIEARLKILNISSIKEPLSSSGIDSDLEIVKKVMANMSGAQVEKLHNETLMKLSKGNKSEAAKRKGISRTAFVARLKKYDPE